MKAEPWTPFGAVVEASDGVITLRGAVFTDTERSALETMLIAGMSLIDGLPGH
jgi:hypothetical protein